MDKILSALSDFRSWVAEQFNSISSAQAELATVKAELATITRSLSERDASIVSLKAELETANTALTAANTSAVTLRAELEAEKVKTTEALAAQGIRPDELPPQTADQNPGNSVTSQVEKLRKKLAATTNPAEKYTLSNQIRELLSKKN